MILELCIYCLPLHFVGEIISVKLVNESGWLAFLLIANFVFSEVLEESASLPF